MCSAASPKVASSLFDAGHRGQGQDQPVADPGQPEQQRDERRPVERRTPPPRDAASGCRHDQRPRRRPDRSVSRSRDRAAARVDRPQPRRRLASRGRARPACGRVAACHPLPLASWPYRTCTGPRGSRTPCTSLVERRLRRTGWQANIIAYTGYGAPGWARVMCRVLLGRPDTRQRGRLEKVRGWRSFTTLPAKHATGHHRGRRRDARGAPPTAAASSTPSSRPTCRPAGARYGSACRTPSRSRRRSASSTRRCASASSPTSTTR